MVGAFRLRRGGAKKHEKMRVWMSKNRRLPEVLVEIDE
jgi:hypothetical protein